MQNNNVKKILVIVTLGIVLSFVYADEQIVTESFLLGKWDCINVHLSASSNGDDNFNYDYKVTDEPIIVIFLKPENYDDYQLQDGEVKKISSAKNIEKYKYNPTYFKGAENENYNTIESGYIYVNNDEFIYYQYSAIFWKYKLKSYGHKQDMTCKRIN